MVHIQEVVIRPGWGHGVDQGGLVPSLAEEVAKRVSSQGEVTWDPRVDPRNFDSPEKPGRLGFLLGSLCPVFVPKGVLMNTWKRALLGLTKG